MNLIQNLEAAWYYHLGSRHLEANDDHGALANFNRALKLQSDHYKAWFGRGMALGKLERHLEALKSFDEALAVEPNASFGWHNRAIALGKLGQWLEALNSFDRALEFSPCAASIWHNRGLTLIDMGLYEKAVLSFDRSLNLHPEAAWAWYNRGNALLELKLYYQALNSFERAIEFKPDDAKAWYNRGLAANYMGLYKQAVASFSRSIALQPGRAEAVGERRVALEKLIGLNQRNAKFTPTSERPFEDYLIWYNRGVELARKRCYSEAIACYETVLEINPDFANAFYNKACCYALLGFADLALDNLQRAVEFIPNLYRELALADSDLSCIWKQERFEALIQG
ncbi:tetratricopeptide repeat protein [Microcoleus vaginatus PCC 9802]|uniref:tetratricopeptide repeat protein n=1 Tax=Microcoleus vaginatus TaxID=119532 RepID=UPI00020D11D4|nr:Tetratricopeptide TPR_2 repeat-containing protein [Microcoleus vaginatus FGP-2]UNU18328.1 tetratricopeptide repeat protein [Microcoleus vaginatus PCC 9802]